MKFKFFRDELCNWVAFGITFNWGDGVYFGVYIAKWLFGLQRVQEKKAVIMAEDLIKYNYSRKESNAGHSNQ